MAGTQHHADAHESEPDDEPAETTEFQPAFEGRRYPHVQRKASFRYLDNQYVVLTNEGESEGYEEAMEDVNKEKWYSARKDEIDSLHENHTYDMMQLPKGKKSLTN